MSDAQNQSHPTGWRSFFTGWHFRSSTPSFSPGQQIEAYLTGYNEQNQCGEARIGDTILRVPGTRPDQVDQLLTLQITQFDPTSNTGEAEAVTKASV